MPFRGSIAVLAFLLLALLPGRAAQALSLPCLGDTLVKVHEIPALNGAELEAGQDLADQRVDLGYLFRGCLGGGAWVGYLSTQSRHIPLSEQQLKLVLAAAGLDALPPVPSYWSSGDNMSSLGIWLVILAALGIGFRRAKARLLDGNDAKAAPGWGQLVEDHAAAYHAATSLPPGRRAVAMPTADAAPSGRPSEGGGRPAGFGKRSAR